MSLADLVPVALRAEPARDWRGRFLPRRATSAVPAWKRWRRKPGVRERLRAYKRAWRARRKA